MNRIRLPLAFLQLALHDSGLGIVTEITKYSDLDAYHGWLGSQ